MSQSSQLICSVHGMQKFKMHLKMLYPIMSSISLKQNYEDFWDILLCSQFKVNHNFREMCHLHLQVASRLCYLLHVGFLLGLFFDPEDKGVMFL
jgi:hypothetical protein